eukprot:1343396-Amorphochlora_amoeboformis.AAC.1
MYPKSPKIPKILQSSFIYLRVRSLNPPPALTQPQNLKVDEVYKPLTRPVNMPWYQGQRGWYFKIGARAIRKLG